MLIKVPKVSSAAESEVTPEAVYLSRRSVLAALAAGSLGGALAQSVRADGRFADVLPPESVPSFLQQKLEVVSGSELPPGEAVTPFFDATHYNNFYEFGSGKQDPSRHADELVTDPWSVEIDGEVARPGRYSLEDLLSQVTLQERIYRLRCVEGWSMVIPWIGFPLAELIRRVEPSGHARYLRFETLVRREQMRGVRSELGLIAWPYIEGLRLDEAMHPLTILAVGMYGRALPNQNGAPLRLVVPWKYGFKSIKSIIRISFVRERPATTWQTMAPEEYGFYANVNPAVSHPRWSQARERRLPNSLFKPNVRPTQLFNGYAEEVASLYSGMDLRKDY